MAIDASVVREADHLDLAPTASSTLQMVIGDAIAVTASRLRNFSALDFKALHPSGSLGRHLLPVRAVMRDLEALPLVAPESSLADLVTVMSEGRMGAACVVDSECRLLGLVVDGDIRRLIQTKIDLYSETAARVMNESPHTLPEDATLGDAVQMMRGCGRVLAVLPIVGSGQRLRGMIHALDL
jgi:arabinose-5-phosphate isomerase